MAKSTKINSKQKANEVTKLVKPDKPYEGFPLYAHASKRWAKKILGKTHFFGKWDQPEKALEKFNFDWPYLSVGRTPPAVDSGEGCTVLDLCNTFLSSKKNKLNSGELSRASFADYFATCERLITHLGKDRRVDDLVPNDFERFRSALASQYGTVTLKNEINRCRIVLKYAHDQRLIKQPVHYGQSFNRPSAKMLRKSRNEAGPRLFESDEIQQILRVADPILYSMVLLGVNCGFGNTDVAMLPQSAVDFKNKWVDFPRPKTEIPRRIPLWTETVDALHKAIALRPEPKDKSNSDLCFITVQGNLWVRTQPNRAVPDSFLTVNTIARRFGAILKKLKLDGRKGRGFYTLRHVFETVGGESRDQVATNAIMGHVDSSMAGVYRERISDERLRDVTDTVHEWLFKE